MTFTPFRRVALRQGPPYAQIRRMAVRRKTSVGLLNVSERDFLAHVCTLAALYGWHGIHTINSKTVCEGVHSPRRTFPRAADHDDAYGFPDLVLAHPARNLGILAELKVRRGKTTPDQDRWLAWFHDLGRVRSFLWYPADEHEITRILKEGWKV